MNEEIKVLKAQVHALSLTLNAVIQTLPALAGAQAAVSLKIAQEEERQEDLLGNSDPTEATVRNAILDAYLDLFSSVASNG